MARYDFHTPRLFVEAPLAAGSGIALGRDRINYLCNVMRLQQGDPVLVFNGRDGEWRAALRQTGRRTAMLIPTEQVRVQEPAGDLHYLFAPLKHARLDYLVQKAVELGASRLQPVLTRHTQASRVNLDRMRANAVEAAEQCGVLNLPEIGEPRALDDSLAALGPDRILVFCDEDAEIGDPVAALLNARGGAAAPLALAVLVGPEGGFTPQERSLLLRRAGLIRLALGPRILRADTAAVAALTLVQAVLGDWR